MVEWVEEYSNLTEKEKSMFEDCANRLLAHSILVAKKDEDKPYYRFYERHLEIFKGYFLVAGWILNCSNSRVISLKNKTGKNRVQLSLSESIMLFIVCKLFYEKSRELKLTNGVHITNLEIREQYMALQINNRLPARDEVKRVLKRFQRHSLIDLVSGEWGEENAVIVIFDSITEVITTKSLFEMEKWIDDMNGKGEDDVDENSFEIEND